MSHETRHDQVAPSMNLDPDLWKILCCPETKQALTALDTETLATLNRKIAAGEVRNKGGAPVQHPLDGGLLRSDGRVLYPIRDTIPLMLVEEGIAVEGLL